MALSESYVNLHGTDVSRLGRWMTIARQFYLHAYLISGLFVAVATFLAKIAFNLVPEASLSLIYLVAIMLSAQIYGLWPSIFASILGILTWDFFFTQPYFSLELESQQDVFTLIFFMIAALSMSGMTAIVRLQNRQLELLAHKNQNLYDFAKELATMASAEKIVSCTIARISKLLSRDAAIALANHAGSSDLVVFSGNEKGEKLSNAELSAALYLDELPQSRVTRDTAFMPLIALRGRVGAMRIDGIVEKPLSSTEKEQLAAMLSQVAIAIERIWLSEEHKAASLAAETERMRNALLLSVSHDLRTPLTTIIGSLSTIDMPHICGDEAGRKELTSIALTEAQRLDRFIGNLLDMTRLELGDLKVRISATVVDEVIASAVQRAQTAVPDHRVLIEIERGLPPVEANFDLLEQALFNLIDNAGRYAPLSTDIEVRAWMNGGSVAIAVLDQGPGIPKELAGTLFQKFARASQGDTGPSGTGLGLTIVKGFVEAIGGTIAVANKANVPGTQFTITLPVVQYGVSDKPYATLGLQPMH